MTTHHSKVYPPIPTIKQYKAYSYRDLPPARRGVFPALQKYLVDHNLSTMALRNSDSVYITETGLCYLLTDQQGRIVFQERHVIGEGTERFANPPAMDLSTSIYYLQGAPQNKKVFIVEGSTDALAVWSHGYTAIGLLGSNVPTTRLAYAFEVLLQNHPNDSVILIPDNDPPGMVMAKKVMRQIPCVLRYLPYGAKDVCDLTHEDRAHFLQGAL